MPRKKTTSKKPSKTIPNPEYIEWAAKNEKPQFLNMIAARSDMASRLANFSDHGSEDPFMFSDGLLHEEMAYFPKDHNLDIPEEGHWIFIAHVPSVEIRVTRFSVWYALPVVRTSGHSFPLHLAKILTPMGELYLWPHEYRKIELAKILPFVGKHYTIHWFGDNNSINFDPNTLHYIMSRGICQEKAIEMLLPETHSQTICWLEADQATQEAFS